MLKVVLPQPVLEQKDTGFFEHVASLYEDAGCSEQVVIFSNRAIQAIETSKTLAQDKQNGKDEQRNNKLSKLWKSVFMHNLNQCKYDEAYNAIVSNPILET